MKNYKIKVFFEKVVEVEADSLRDARDMAIEKVGRDYFDDVRAVSDFNAEEHEEPINWRERAKSDAMDAMENYNLTDAVVEAVDKAESDTSVDDIYEKIYQEKDLCDIAWQIVDGIFIWNDSESLKDAMECINRLDEYASGDSGLWEGCTEHYDIINRQADDAFRGAVMHSLEELIREKISELLIKEKISELRCTAKDCEELQTDDEFCDKHSVEERYCTSCGYVEAQTTEKCKECGRKMTSKINESPANTTAKKTSFAKNMKLNEKLDAEQGRAKLKNYVG